MEKVRYNTFHKNAQVLRDEQFLNSVLGLNSIASKCGQKWLKYNHLK